MDRSVARELEVYTARNSRFETERDYISLSHASLSVDEIILQRANGFEDSELIRLRCYKGYQMEDDLKRRIKAVFGDRVEMNVEVSAFDGLVKGHPDFTFDGYPADCKTVPLDEHLPKDKKVSRKVYAQMQAYMLYMQKPKSLVIYESRETGKLVDIWLRANEAVQREIDKKFYEVVTKLYPV
jgi:hypothetical protein